MAKAREYQGDRNFLVRLQHKGDILEELTRFCADNEINAAFISAIGAVEKGTIGYYDQVEKVYKSILFDEHMEIAHLGGNLSLKDGQPIVHAHIVLSKENGETFSGHLMSPTIIFACEANIAELKGEPLTRGYDEDTGLPLWSELK